MRKKSLKFRISATLLIFTVLSACLQAQEKIGKEIHETYTIKEGTILSIQNKFGNIDLQNWDKNMVDIKVQIKLFNVSESKAQDILNAIKINYSVEGNTILFTTEFDEDFGSKWNGNHGDKKFEVNYIVNMPQTLPVSIENKYGNVFVDKLSATSTIQVKYGKLNANYLASTSNDNLTQINLAYSDGTIEQCSWIKTDIKYAKLNIKESKALIIVSKYSKLYLEHGSSLVAQSKYDEYEVGSVANFVAQSEYSNYRFKSIGKKLQSETSYSDVKIAYMPPSFESISITNRYGSYQIGIEEGASYKINGAAKYGDIKYPEESRVNRIQETVELNINGYVGSNASSKSHVSIDTKYGTVSLQ